MMEVITFRIEKEDYAKLASIAKKLDRNISYLIRKAIEEYIKKINISS